MKRDVRIPLETIKIMNYIVKRRRVEGETGGGRNRRKEGEEEGGEGEGGTICTPLWILPGNHTLAESR